MEIKFRHWKLWHWLALALAIRLYKLTQTHCIAKDGVEYINIAYSWLSGIGFHPVWPPLYPWLISLLVRFGIEPEFSGQLVSVIFGVLTVAMVYVVTKHMFSQALARVATVFAVFHPYLVRYSSETLADSLFTFLIIAVVFSGWLGLTQTLRTGPGLNRKELLPALFVGVGAALAYLTKPEGAVLVIIVSLWWLFSKRKVRKKSAIVLCTWLVFLIIIFPYLYSIRSQTGEWIISQKQNVVFSISLQKEGFTEELLDVSPLEYALSNPKQFFRKVGSNLLILVGRFIDAYNPFLFILLVIGLFTPLEKAHLKRAELEKEKNLFRKSLKFLSNFLTGFTKWGPKQKKVLWYLFSFFIPYFIGYAIFHPGRRYLVNWVPLFLFLAAAGCERITDWLPQRLAGKVLLFVTILILLPKTLEPIRKDGLIWKESGFWIKRQSGGGASVMAEDGRVAFYAQGKYIPWDKGKFNEADYIVSEENISHIEEIYRSPNGVIIYHGANFTK